MRIKILISCCLAASMIFTQGVYATSSNNIEIIDSTSVVGDTTAITAFELINELVKISMLEQPDNFSSADSSESKGTGTRKDEILNQLDLLGVEKLSCEEAMEIAGEQIANLTADYPLPSSNERIDYYSIYYTTVNNQRAYCLIAAPIVNSDHSAIQYEEYDDIFGNPKNMSELLLNGAATLFEIYSEKVVDTLIDGIISMIPLPIDTVLDWMPFDIFDELFGGNYSSGAIPEYEMFMQTRTVTMFVYLKNNANQPVYYGSANCVHTNVEQTARKYVGSQLVSEIENMYEIAYAENYLTFPDYCIPSNTTGYSVTPMHSFVRYVGVKVADNSVIGINVPTYEQLIQSIQ